MIIDAVLPEILLGVERGQNLVIEAAPGAGKTTGVPPALLKTVKNEIIVLEPRRMAARMAARRVANELGERLGETVGYQVRFEEISGPKTRLRYVTEGVLTRQLLSDPELRRAGVVILDEFHERHLDGDVALALLRNLQRTSRRDLRLIAMSATMDTAPVARLLGDCPVVRSAGREFPLDVAYTPHSPQPLEAQVGRAVERLANGGIDGDILVFLPGAAEIRRAARECEPIARRMDLLIAPLHGDLSPEEQDRAVSPSARRKLILSTNVAESSVTIEGVTAVIDSGLARIASDSPWTGLPRLAVQRVSQASANQRAGRAGRVRSGRVIRLYSQDDFARRPAQETPEIGRRELAQVVLDMRAMGIRDLEWLEPPPAGALEAAEELLGRIGAVDRNGITEDGRRMSRLPLHPRLARLAIDGAPTLAALLSSGERLPPAREQTGPSDLFLLQEADWAPRTRQLVDQIRRMAARRDSREDAVLLKAVLAAFPDRVARRRQGQELLLASGGSALLAKESVVRGHDLLVAVEIEDRPEKGLPLVRLASAIQPEWLLDLHPERMREESRVEWNRSGERVDAVSVLMYDQIAIEETRGAKPDPEAAAKLLAEKALEAGIGRFCDPKEIGAILARVAFASEHASVPKLTDDDVRAALEAACTGLRSFAELKSVDLAAALMSRLPPRSRRVLDEVAPLTLRLPSGRNARVQYAADQPPWVASRLQDFFGLTETPRIARGKVPLVVHLLAPNQRPVQTTTDLAGFWQRLYPQVRRELSRRYPRHAWPEKPAP